MSSALEWITAAAAVLAAVGTVVQLLRRSPGDRLWELVRTGDSEQRSGGYRLTNLLGENALDVVVRAVDADGTPQEGRIRGRSNWPVIEVGSSVTFAALVNWQESTSVEVAWTASRSRRRRAWRHQLT